MVIYLRWYSPPVPRAPFCLCFSLCSLLLVDFCQSLFEETHSAEDDTAVHLELGLTRSRRPTDPAATQILEPPPCRSR